MIPTATGVELVLRALHPRHRRRRQRTGVANDDRLTAAPQSPMLPPSPNRPPPPHSSETTRRLLCIRVCVTPLIRVRETQSPSAVLVMTADCLLALAT